jgi:hypothetical protein
LHKRIAFRHEVAYIEEPENFFGMMDDVSEGTMEPATKDIGITEEELLAVQQHLYTIPFAEQAKGTLWELRSALNDAGFFGAMDDRLGVWLISITRAEALYERAYGACTAAIDAVLPSDAEELANVDKLATAEEQTKDLDFDITDITIEPQHFAIAQHCFWTAPKEIVPIRGVVLGVASPVADEALKYIDDAMKNYTNAEAAQRNNGINDNEKQQAGLDANAEISEIVETIRKRIKETEGTSQKHFKRALDKVAGVHKRVLEEILGVNI